MFLVELILAGESVRILEDTRSSGGQFVGRGKIIEGTGWGCGVGGNIVSGEIGNGFGHGFGDGEGSESIKGSGYGFGYGLGFTSGQNNSLATSPMVYLVD